MKNWHKPHNHRGHVIGWGSNSLIGTSWEGLAPSPSPIITSKASLVSESGITTVLGTLWISVEPLTTHFLLALYGLCSLTLFLLRDYPTCWNFDKMEATNHRLLLALKITPFGSAILISARILVVTSISTNTLANEILNYLIVHSSTYRNPHHTPNAIQ